MEYRLTITRQEKNPKWSDKQDASCYRQSEEQEYLTRNTALEVVLNEMEFTAIKKAVIEVIK